MQFRSYNPNSEITIALFLVQQVTKYKRVVNDLYTMVGDVGGLYDFNLIIFTPLFSAISQNFMVASLIQKLFHGALEPVNPRLGPKEHFDSIRPLSFSRCFTLFKSCRRKGLRHQALALG